MKNQFIKSRDQCLTEINEIIKISKDMGLVGQNFELSDMALSRLLNKIKSSIYDEFNDQFDHILPFLVGYEIGVNEK